MIGCKQFIDQLLNLRTKLLGLGFGMMDLEARHTEFFLGVVGLEGGKTCRRLSVGYERPRVGLSSLKISTIFSFLQSEADDTLRAATTISRRFWEAC